MYADCRLSLKSFEENAGMAAPGWALTGKNAAGAVNSRRQRSEDVLVRTAPR